MSEVLSQNEIDALLNAVSTGEVQTATAQEPIKNDWVAYDLSSQEKIFHGRLAGLEEIHERYSRLLRVSLSSLFNKNVTVSATSTEYMKFGDYLSNIIKPTALNLFSIPTLQGTMLLLVSSKLVYAMLDSYYGGAERPFAKLGNPDEFTSVEKNIIKRFSQIGMKSLEEAWKLNYPIQIQYAGMESNPAFIGAIHSTELVAVVTFEVGVGQLSGSFSLIIQLHPLDPIHEQLSVRITSEQNQDANTWQKHWLRELMDIPVELRAEVGNSMIDVEDLRTWKVGEVVSLRQDATSPLTVFIESIPKIKGMMGMLRGNTAVRITDM